MKILVVSGSSGGHIFPALSFIGALREKQKNAKVLLLLPKRIRQKQIPVHGVALKYISTAQINLTFDWRNIPACFEYLKGLAQTFFIITEFKPDLVVGFGSIDSIPCIMLAWLFRIRTLIHEQNVVPGRANKLLAKFVDKVALSFAQAGAGLKVNASKLIVTGNPIRHDLIRITREQALDFFGFKDKPTVLVTGGSQGSSRINEYFFKAVKGLGDLQVIHICGASDRANLTKNYSEAGIAAKVFSFLNEIQYAYSAADLAVCRGGATTIAELSYYAIPAIIIPYPYAYAHQLENAKILEKQGSALIVLDKDLDSGALTGKLGCCIDRKVMDDMRLSYGSIDKPAAAELLADAALSSIENG